MERVKKILVVLLGVTLVMPAIDAEGTKKGKKKAKKATATKTVTVPPQSDQIAPMIERFRWGMSSEEVMGVLSKIIEETYRQKMAKANDPVKEDKLHQVMMSKINELKKNYIKFDGQVTSFDSSLVKGEYTHKNNEAMILFPKDVKMGRKWDDYFFFINDRLWKIFRAFDADMFPGLSWADVQAAMVAKFGPNPLEVKHFDPDTRIVKVTGLKWQDAKTLLTLLDYTTFYGIFCLRFEDKKILAQIDTLRANRPKVEKKTSVVDIITQGTGVDTAADIVDRLTSKKGGEPSAKGADKGDDSVPPPKKKQEEILLDDF